MHLCTALGPGSLSFASYQAPPISRDNSVLQRCGGVWELRPSRPDTAGANGISPYSPGMPLDTPQHPGRPCPRDASSAKREQCPGQKPCSSCPEAGQVRVPDISAQSGSFHRHSSTLTQVRTPWGPGPCAPPSQGCHGPHPAVLCFANHTQGTKGTQDSGLREHLFNLDTNSPVLK